MLNSKISNYIFICSLLLLLSSNGLFCSAAQAETKQSDGALLKEIGQNFKKIDDALNLMANSTQEEYQQKRVAAKQLLNEQIARIEKIKINALIQAELVKAWGKHSIKYDEIVSAFLKIKRAPHDIPTYFSAQENAKTSN